MITKVKINHAQNEDDRSLQHACSSSKLLMIIIEINKSVAWGIRTRIWTSKVTLLKYKLHVSMLMNKFT